MLPLYGEALYRLGLGILCGAAALGGVSAVVFCVTGRILGKKLDRDYGRKHQK